MASDQEYERVLSKVEFSGTGNLSSTERDLFQRLLKEISSRGDRARRLLNK